MESWTTPVPPASDATRGWDLAPGCCLWTPDQDPATTVGTTRATQSPAKPIPTGFDACRVTFAYDAWGKAGEDRFSTAVLVDGVEVINQDPPMDPFL